MATYMVQAAYTAEKWKDMVAGGHCTEGRTVRPVIQKLGGTVVCGYVSFGKYDVVVIYEISDHVGATAVSAALASSRIFKTIETTPLMPSDQADRGIAKAKDAGYGA
jgi:uncharacterized protein with GYD domain